MSVARECDDCGGSTAGANTSVTDDLCVDCYEARQAQYRAAWEDAYERRAYAADCRHDAARDVALYDDSRPDGRGADEVAS